MGLKMYRRVAAALMLGLAIPTLADTLPDLLRATLDHPAVIARQDDLQAATAGLTATESAYFGSAKLTADGTHYNAAQFMGSFTPTAFANPDFASSQWTMGASYALPVDLFGVIAANRARAKEDVDAAGLALRQESLMRLHETLSAWVRLQALQEKERSLETERQQVNAMVQRVKGQVEAGTLATSDLSLAESEAGRVDAEGVQLAGERASVLAQLEESTGKAVAADTAVNSPLDVPEWPTGVAEDSLPVRLADSRARASANEATSAERGLWPSVNADAGYARYLGGGNSENTWYVGARVSVPIDPVAWHQQAAAAQKAEAARQEGQASRRETARDLVALNARYNAAKAAMEATKREIIHRRDVVAVQDELAKVGALTTEDALLHQRNLTEAEVRLADARAEALIAWSAAEVIVGDDPEHLISAVTSHR